MAMAEILGATTSVVMLVGLLKGCLTAVEVIETSKSRDEDVDTFNLKLTLEQFRLKNWGRSVGLLPQDDTTIPRNLLGNFEFEEVVERAVGRIFNLLTDANSPVETYGAEVITADSGSSVIDIESTAKLDPSSATKHITFCT